MRRILSCVQSEATHYAAFFKSLMLHLHATGALGHMDISAHLYVLEHLDREVLWTSYGQMRALRDRRNNSERDFHLYGFFARAFVVVGHALRGTATEKLEELAREGLDHAAALVDDPTFKKRWGGLVR